VPKSAVIKASSSLLFLAVVIGATSAAAMTNGECRRQYAANKHEIAARGQNEKEFTAACRAGRTTISDPPPAAGAEANKGAAADVNKLREAAQNPVADLVSVQFQENVNFGYGPYSGTQSVLNFQPVIPIHLNEDWNLIARPITPIVYQPRLAPDLGPEFGLSNIQPQLYLSPANPGKIIWGAGAAFYLPTATNKTLGVNAWGAGPGFVALTIQEPWVLGALVNNVWAWRNGQQVDQMTFQYFINYNVPHGWYLTSSPVITADWRAPAHDRWVVPFGGGAGRLFRVEGLPPINAQIQGFYNAVRPTAEPLTGPVWSLCFQLSFLFPTG
jgi:hypothetical protein